MNKTRLIATSVFALSLFGASNASAQDYVCDAESFTQDVSTFGEVTETFEDYTYFHENLYNGASMLMADFELSDGEVELGSGICSADEYAAGECDANALWHYGSVTMRPLVPMTSIAFTYAAQPFWQSEITIALSDGSERTFLPALDVAGPNWAYDLGDFGYCTGDPSLTITEIRFHGPDGAIDNITGTTATPACDDLDGDGYTTCDADCDDNDATAYPGALEICDGVDNSCDGWVDVEPDGADVCDQGCSADSLQESILALELHSGFENALLSKLDAAVANIDAGRTRAGINNLNAMVHQINAQRGKKIADDDADALLSCIAAVLATLS